MSDPRPEGREPDCPRCADLARVWRLQEESATVRWLARAVLGAGMLAGLGLLGLLVAALVAW